MIKQILIGGTEFESVKPLGMVWASCPLQRDSLVQSVNWGSHFWVPLRGRHPSVSSAVDCFLHWVSSHDRVVSDGIHNAGGRADATRSRSIWQKGKGATVFCYFDTLPAGWIWKIWLGFGGSQMSNRWKFG